MYLAAAAGNTLGVACVLASPLHLDSVVCIWPSCNYGGVCEDPPMPNTSVTVSILTSAGLTCTFFWQAGAASLPHPHPPHPTPPPPATPGPPHPCAPPSVHLWQIQPQNVETLPPVTWAHLCFPLPLVVCLKKKKKNGGGGAKCCPFPVWHPASSQFEITDCNQSTHERHLNESSRFPLEITLFFLLAFLHEIPNFTKNDPF